MTALQKAKHTGGKVIKSAKVFIDKSAENYNKPTPKKWKKIGKAIFGLGTVVTTVSALTGQVWLTILSAGLTWIGSTITDFASES